jgi:hypothetical protein
MASEVDHAEGNVSLNEIGVTISPQTFRKFDRIPEAAFIAGSAKDVMQYSAAVMVKDATPPETQEEALEFLARRLDQTMEFLDPSNDHSEWEQLSEHQREFYRACVNSIFQERRVARIALGHENAPGIVTPEMIRSGSSVLTELQDAGCYQGYVLERVYLAMRGLEEASAE